MAKLIQVSNFKFGLDTRREALVSQPGTLVTLNNAHVDQGGEIEKRKAFVDMNGVTAWPTNTFGLVATDAGLLVFGSDAAVSGGTLPSSPIPVTYVRLQHPTVIWRGSGAYNATYHAMTAVVACGNFNGKAVVAAKFSDGRVYLYYDGGLIWPSATGLVLEGSAATTVLSKDLANAINTLLGDVTYSATNDGSGAGNLGTTNWYAASNTDASMTHYAYSEDGVTYIYSPPSDYFSEVPVITSSKGQIGYLDGLTKDFVPTTGVKPKAAFAITAVVANDTITITAPRSNTDATMVDICGGPVRVGTSDGATATTIDTARAIVDMINAMTATTSYSATIGAAGSSEVWIYAPSKYTNFSGSHVTVTPSSGSTTVGAATNDPNFIGATVTPSPVSVQATAFMNAGTQLLVGTATANPIGLTGTVSFAWTLLDNGGAPIADGINWNPLYTVIAGAPIGTTTWTGASIQIGVQFWANQPRTVNQLWKVVVTDTIAGAFTIIVNFTFKLVQP